MLGISAFAAGPFDGKWVIDKGAGQVAGGPDFKEVEIKQKGDDVTIRSKYIEPPNGIYPLLWLGVMSMDFKLKANGEPTDNLLGPFKHQSKTKVEGNTMTTDFQAANEAGEAVSGQWIRKVSDDGKSMTLEVHTKASDGKTLDRTLNFKKK